MNAARKIRPTYKASTEWLPVSSIEVNPLAQRPLDMGRVKHYADAFDPDKVGFPFIAKVPNGKGVHYYAIDGQHRVFAAKMAFGEDQFIECEVVEGISLQRAAELFRGRNDTRQVKPIDKFLVGVTAKDDECVAINDIVNSVGLTVDRNTRDGTVSAIAALQRVYRGDKTHGNGKNVLALKRTLGTALSAWGRTGEAMNGSVIEGLGSVVLRYGDVLDFDSLEKKLRQFKGGALGLLGAARGLRDSFGGSVANCVAHQIVIVYNRGRARHTLQDWNRGKDDE